MDRLIRSLKGGLIVSCQAGPGSPFDSPAMLAAFARCAEQAGAVGIRANTPANIAEIASHVALPIIGINKREVAGYEVYITPEFSDAEAVCAAGARIVALDATNRPRPGVDGVPSLIGRIRSELHAIVMADISTLDEGLAAADAGADLVATTLHGYTSATRSAQASVDLDLVRRLASRLAVPVICEGRVHTPDQARAALHAGAYAVVVGTAITAPCWIAAQFVTAVRVEASG